MSLNGLKQFSDNAKMIIGSPTFQKSNFEKKCEISYRLLNSRFGVGMVGKVDKLPDFGDKPTEEVTK